MNDYIPFNNESDLNPFIPIRKEPLESSDGTTSNRFSIQIEDLKADSGWKEVGDVSKSYFLISNAEMRKVSEDITDASNMNFELDKTFFNGKVFYESWTTGDISSEVKHNEVGDPLIAGLMFQNSYDGSRKAAMWGFIKRLVCSNGMIASFLFKNWRFKHTRISENWQEEIQRATSLLEHFPDRLDKFAKICTRLTTEEVDVHDLAYLRESRLNKLPDSAWGKVIDKFLKERQTDIGSFTQYDLLNACTGYFWHKKKATVSDFDWNAYCVNGIINNKRFLKSEEEHIKSALTIPEA